MSDHDDRWLRAFAHSIRRSIIEYLLEHHEASAKTIAEALELNLSSVSYHVRYLHDSRHLTLTRQVARRGAMARFYRLTNPRATDDAARRLRLSLRSSSGPEVAAPPASPEWVVLGIVTAELHQRRRTRRISLEQLAEVVGINPPYLVRVEEGKTDMRYTVLAGLARELGTTLGELFVRAEDQAQRENTATHGG
jgi:DNA-binding XRE family transcriptional regulator